MTTLRARVAVLPKRTLALASAILVCTIVAASAAAKETTPRAIDLQKDVDALVAAGAPGAILLVRDGDETTRLTGGYADLATKAAMQPADHYRIASLTKTYVAAVVLQLVAEES